MLILFCKQSKALKWLSVLTDIPCYRRCMTAARYLPHKCAACHLLLCVPWVVGHPSQAMGGGTAFPSHRWWDSPPKPQVVGQPSQAPAGWGCAPSNSMTTALVCSPGSKNSAQPEGEYDCHNWVACESLCHRLLYSSVCFRLIMKSKQLTACAK